MAVHASLSGLLGNFNPRPSRALLNLQNNRSVLAFFFHVALFIFDAGLICQPFELSFELSETAGHGFVMNPLAQK